VAGGRAGLSYSAATVHATRTRSVMCYERLAASLIYAIRFLSIMYFVPQKRVCVA
jgi:hypothetical protein